MATEKQFENKVKNFLMNKVVGTSNIGVVQHTQKVEFLIYLFVVMVTF